MTAIEAEHTRQAAVATREEAKDAEAPAEVRVHEDHTRELRTPGFSRMRTEWNPADAAQIVALKSIVDGQMLQMFADAYSVMNDLWDIVREPDVDDQGVVREDVHGFVVWKRNESGAFIEDYSRLGIREREDFLFRITTNLFEWEQRRAELWGNAMFSKALWEETMATGFVKTPGARPTVDDRTQHGRLYAVDERYFAIFQTLLSKTADAIVDSMALIGQRLKDTL